MKKILFPIIIFSLLIFSTSYSQNTWQWVNPKPNGETYSQIQFVGSNTIYMLNVNGNLTKSTDNGSNWINIKKYFNNEYFFSMYFINENTGFIGSDSNIYKSTTGGESWNLISIPGTNFYDIQFLNDLTGFVVNSDNLFKTTNAGTNWNVLYTETTDEGIQKLQFLNETTGYIMTDSKLLKTTNNGINFYGLFPGMGILVDFDFFSEDTGVLIGSYGTEIRKTINGNNFHGILNTPNHYANSIEFLNENKIVVCGQISGPNFEERIYLSTNSGSSFSTIPLVFSFGEKALNFKDLNTGITIGFDGIFHMTTNGGFNWQFMPKGFFQPSYDLEFANFNTGFISSDSGKIYKTIDNGINWLLFSSTGIDKRNLSIKFFDQNTGYVLTFNNLNNSNSFAKTTNSGINWNFVSTDIATGQNKIYFINQNTGFMWRYNPVAVNTIYRTINGGLNWNPISIENSILTNFYTIDGSVIFAGTENSKILKSYNAGENWQSIPIPGTSRIFNFKFYNSELGFFSTYTNNGISINNIPIYKTTNSGLNWSMFKNYNFKLVPGEGGEMGFNFLDSLNIFGYAGRSFYRSNSHSDSLKREFMGIANAFIDMHFFNDSTGILLNDYGGIVKTTNGGISFIKKISNDNIIIKDFSLHQNYPNPFNPETNIKFNIAKTELVKLTVYDISGKEVYTLVNQNLSPGIYEVNFNGRNLSSGIYFYTLRAGNYFETKKMMLIK